MPETRSPAPQLSPGQHLRFERISLEQGLSQSTVFCILQDSQGFMWSGTPDGLGRYDGNVFQVFKHNLQGTNGLTAFSGVLFVVQELPPPGFPTSWSRAWHFDASMV
jgi:hypothetical protein